MSAPQELKGPDLSAGIEGAELKEREPLLGHANGEAVVLVKQGGEVCEGYARSVSALQPAARDPRPRMRS